MASCRQGEQDGSTSFHKEASMRRNKNFTSLKTLLQTLSDKGSWEPEKREALAKVIANLEHALKVGDKRSVYKAVDDLARSFLSSIA
jgi:hypothetical protein